MEPKDLLTKFQESSNYLLYGFDIDVLAEYSKYTNIRDIHDRIIIATSSILMTKLITKDEGIINSGYATKVW
ncbi:hypothetical protein HYS31_00190 [Candidatus Woesearchaeota archaeon]|nr:hypothetical protein [Candidatus Woesearchaeota archaeon]